MSHAANQYNKPARSLPDLITHLETKGLFVPDKALALATLKRIYYFRLLIYMRPLQDSNTKQFIFGAKFDDIVALYNFDRKLRLLCLDAIERIEVALRAALVNTLTPQHNPHFYLESRHFDKAEAFKEFLQKAMQTKSIAMAHYIKTYNTPPLPPVWVVLEGVTYGALSRLFSNLHINNQKLVAAEFNYDRTILVSWFRSLNSLRNVCAHHNRLWNATKQPDAPTMKAKRVQGVFPASNDGFCARAVVLGALMQEIEPSSDWRLRMRALIKDHSFISPAAMGFQPGWDQLPFWNT